MEHTKKKPSRRIILGVLALLAAIAVLAGLYGAFGPHTAAGAKQITITATNDVGETATYSVTTHAETLHQALDEATGLTVAGTDGAYGFMVETVNGVTADYTADKAYWCIYVDGEYGSYGVDAQPVADGQTFALVYTVDEG